MPRVEFTSARAFLRRSRAYWLGPCLWLLLLAALWLRAVAYHAGEQFAKLMPIMLLAAAGICLLCRFTNSHSVQLSLEDRTPLPPGALLLAPPGILLMIGLCLQAILVAKGHPTLSEVSWPQTAGILLIAAAAVKWGWPVLRKLLDKPFVVMLLPLITIAIYVVTLKFGVEINRAKNWLKIGPMMIQPSEFARVLYIISLAAILNHRWFRKTPRREILQLALCIGLTAACALFLLLQNELGSLLFMGLSMIVMMTVYVDNHKKLLKIALVLAAVCAALVLLTYGWAKSADGETGKKVMGMFEKVFGRVDTWWNFGALRLSEVDEIRRQIHQMDRGLKAMAAGGLFGADSRYYVYVPVAESDMAFPFFAQIFGLALGVGMVALYYVFARSGLRSALAISSSLDQAVAFGFVSSLFLQAFMQVCGSCGLLPVSGNTLPFVSHGGSSLLACALMVGLLFRFHQQTLKENGFAPYRARAAHRRREYNYEQQ